MRAPVLVGIALIVIGGTVFLRGLSAPKTILKVGDISSDNAACFNHPELTDGDASQKCCVGTD